MIQDAYYKVPTIEYGRAREPLHVSVPGSKSITNRALLLAMLADGTSTLRRVLFSDDSRYFIDCVRELGFDVSVNGSAREVTVTGLGGGLPRREASLYVGSAGTAARFLAATLGVSEGTFHMDASKQMRKRPMEPLLTALEELGCEVCAYGTGAQVPAADSAAMGAHATDGATAAPTHFPFTLRSHGFCLNHISIDIGSSSQFLSALLIASVLSAGDFTIDVRGTHGMAYIEMTRRMMEQFGVHVEQDAERRFRIPTGQKYCAREYDIEPDASAAAYFYAMAPLLGIPVCVEGVHFDSLQGDVEFIRILERMGCEAEELEAGVLLKPPTKGFHGITVDMSACSDQAITLAAIAPYADAPTTITGIGHIRLQESDRLHGIATELSRMGIHCEEGESSITIYPGQPHAAEIETYDDHRMAMGFALTGLRAEGIVIKNPSCCRKTFEDYFEVLEGVVASLR